PAVRLDVGALKQTLTFAFASGVPSAAFAQALESATLPPSTWEPRSFAKEIFLSELIVGCFKVTIEGHRYTLDQANLARILGRPPADSAVADFRRGVIDMLARSTPM